MKKILYLALVAFMLISCGQKSYQVPTSFEERQAQANIYPDYKDITIPENIAPLNFMVEVVQGMVVVLKGQNGQELVASGIDRIDMDTTAWRALLKENAGGKLSVVVYTLEGEKWYKHAQHTLTIAEPIDAYLSYRLIEPGYELYRQLGIYQRCLENFTQKPIYENNRSYDDNNNHCINCHNYRMGSTESMLFHVRSNHGGTIIVQNGKAHKIQLKDSTIIASGVYPSWHPTVNLVAFSTNKTGSSLKSKSGTGLFLYRKLCSNDRPHFVCCKRVVSYK